MAAIRRRANGNAPITSSSCVRDESLSAFDGIKSGLQVWRCSAMMLAHAFFQRNSRGDGCDRR